MMKQIKILLVEDEATLAIIIRDTLNSQGFQVITAENGEHGLQLFFHERPDVLVADVMMPPHRYSSSQHFPRLRMW